MYWDIETTASSNVFYSLRKVSIPYMISVICIDGVHIYKKIFCTIKIPEGEL
jgi:hypothetical protein